MKWTKDAVDKACVHLIYSDDMDIALANISSELGQPISYKSLEGALRRNYSRTPLQFLGMKQSFSDMFPPITDVFVQQPERILFVPDTHVPFEDTKAFNLVLSVIRGYRPHRIVILGDFADCLEMSSHPKSGPAEFTFQQEMSAVNRALDALDAAAKDAGTTHKHYVYGNHENRLPRYVAQKAPELHGAVTFENQTRLTARAWLTTDYNDFLKIGKLYVTHDVGTAGANAHKDAVAAFEGSAVIGHVHRVAVSYSGNVAGSSHVGATFGWLGDRKHVGYMHKSKVAKDWHLGFGTGTMLSDGTVFLQAHPIIDYKTVVDGVVYSLN